MTFLLALLGGIVGAAVGFFLAATGAAMLAPVLGISSFEGEAGYFAVFLIGPLGGIVGLVAGVVLVLWTRGVRSFAAFAGRFAIILIAIIGLVAAGVGYMYWNRDLVNSNGSPPQLAFEIRLPGGTALPTSPNDIAIHLDSNKSHMPASVAADKFRRDGDRPVIVGSVEVYHRESNRFLVLRLPNEPDRLFTLKLGKNPARSKELSPWQQVDFIADPGQNPRRATADENFEVRYRAVWVGED
jgi:hypothetical protein